MPSNIAIDPTSGRPYILEGADDATLIEDPDGRGAYLLRGGADAEVDHNDVYRSVDGGASWELVASGLPLNATITDPECLVGAPTRYRVEAWTLLPSSSATTVELDADSMATWLSGGDGFGQVVRLPYNPSVKVSAGLASREVQHFAGRTLGVEMAGTARARTVSIGSLLIEEDPTSESSTSEDVEALSYLPAPILYRDPTGRRIYTSMQRPDLSRDHLRRWTLSVTLEEVDRDG